MQVQKLTVTQNELAVQLGTRSMMIYINSTMEVNSDKKTFELYIKGKKIFKDASMNLRDQILSFKVFSEVIKTGENTR